MNQLKIYELTDKNCNIVSIVLRNKWEKQGRRYPQKALTEANLEQMISLYKHLDPIEKIDNALINFEKASDFVGESLVLEFEKDYPLYHCKNEKELRSICKICFVAEFTDAPDMINPHSEFNLTAKGYARIRDIKLSNKESNQAFVAMWFGDEMTSAYNKAIKPAIEFVEPGEKESRFKAQKINEHEHINDINDEIIAQIRRSRFMVCDLTGYRGGVYFEAGFAYGLGLDVIYTCRKDWTTEDILKDAPGGKEVKKLFDKNGKEIKVKKEGVHFDLSHRNRISWEPSEEGLKDFREKLENRIKAVIY